MSPVPQCWRRALLRDHISQRNKLALIAGLRSRGYTVEYDWPGLAYSVRMKVRFDGAGPWLSVLSYELDLRPTLETSR